MNNVQDPNNPFAGSWIHRDTGERIKVRNSILDGDRMIVLTEDGRQMESSEFSENWFRLDAEDEEIIQLTDLIKSENKVSEKAGRPAARSLTEHAKRDTERKQPGVLDKIFGKTPLSICVDASEMSLPVEALKVAMEYFDIETVDIEDYINKHIKIEIIGLNGCLFPD